jgi:hypothetical protein
MTLIGLYYCATHRSLTKEHGMPRRKTSWAIIVWTVLFAIWIIVGIAGNDCGSQTGDRYLSQHAAQDACAAGTGIGVALIFFLWFIGFIVLSIVWFLTRNRNARDCPVCGKSVKRGLVECRNCGYDFRTHQQRTDVPAETASP